MRRSAIAFALLGLAVGCDRVAGLNEYTTTGEEPLRYLDSPECRSCIDSHCDTQVAACEADELCRSTHACRRKCTDPACHLACTHPANDDRAWAQLDPPGIPQPIDYPLAMCALENCREACQTGRSWQCVGEYDVPTPEPGDLTIRHRAFVSLGWSSAVAGVKLRICTLNDFECATGLAESTTDELGRAEFTLENVRNFDIYLLVQHPDFPTTAYYSKQRPRFGREYSAYGMSPTSQLTVGSGLHLSRAHFFPQFFDCAGFWADDLVAELEVFDGTDFVACPECAPLYTRDFVPSLSQKHTLPDGALVLFAQLPPLPARLRAYDVDTGKRVAEAELFLRPGRVHAMGVQPLSGRAAQAQ